MDSTFEFFSSANVQLLDEILNRRNPNLLGRIRESDSVSQPDAEDVLATLSEEFTDHLDDDWEPTSYARKVDSLLDQVNAARIKARPD